MKDYDVIIIGAGVSGCAIARELAKGKLRIAVLEAKSDVCEGTSKANSGIVHAGYDAVPGTLKAQLNVRGNEMMEELSKKLDFPFRRNGSLVLCFEEDAMSGLEELYQRGMENGVKELKLLSPEEVWAMEPAVSRDIVGALYAPTGGIVCPFGLNIALAENAAENGVEFYRDHKVTAIVEQRPVWTENPPAKEGRMYQVQTEGEMFEAPVIINAAGVYADEIHNMICEEKIRIVPRRGEYRLMDKNCGDLVNSTIFQQPSKMGKGILVTPTVHGNLLVGPTAEDIPDKQDVDTTAEGLAKVLNLGSNSVDALDGRQTITSFAGLRAHLVYEDPAEKSDFLIEEAAGHPGFIDVAGIESPGLTSAPAIGEYVAQIVENIYPAERKSDFIDTRKGGKWNGSIVRDIAVNEKYVGDALFQKTYTDDSFHRHTNHGEVGIYLVSDHHEPIVSREVFEKANALIRQRAAEKGVIKGSDKYQKRYAFSGKIVCGVCGRNFKRRIHNGGAEIAWTCAAHIEDAKKCSVKYVRDDVLKVAFVTMLNKLIFSRKLILKPLLCSLKSDSSDKNVHRMQELQKLLETNTEKRNTLRWLRSQEIIDTVMYNQEMNLLKKQAEDYRNEISRLSQYTTGEAAGIAGLEHLLRFTESTASVQEFSDALFLAFVDHIIVYDRNYVGFKLKCGLTLKEVI